MHEKMEHTHNVPHVTVARNSTLNDKRSEQRENINLHKVTSFLRSLIFVLLLSPFFCKSRSWKCRIIAVWSKVLNAFFGNRFKQNSANLVLVEFVVFNSDS